MTNGSKVLIYLTLLHFIFYCTLVSIAKGNVAKSNKSELRNRLSYRGLPYLFEVRSKTFRNDCQISRQVAASKFRDCLSFDNLRIQKKMSWDNPVSPIDAKSRIGFFVQFFLGQPVHVGDSMKDTVSYTKNHQISNVVIYLHRNKVQAFKFEVKQALDPLCQPTQVFYVTPVNNIYFVQTIH